jgi:hypothetical protein
MVPVAKASFSTDEQQMKLLKDKAIFADSERTRFQSVKALASFGSEAEHLVSEVLDSTCDPGLKRYCSELLDRMKSSNSAKTMIGAVFALVPCLVIEAGSFDMFLPS